MNRIRPLIAGLALACAAAQPLRAEPSLWSQVRGSVLETEDSDPVERAEKALHEAERQRGPNHPDVAEALDILASLYESDGRFEDATKSLERALKIHELNEGAGSPGAASMRQRLAMVSLMRDRPEEAERLLKQALAMRLVELGDYHPDVASALDDLAVLYRATGRDAEVEPLLKRSVAIREWHKEQEPLAYGRSLNVLASYYVERKRIDDAIVASEQALAVDEAAPASDGAIVATDLSNLAALYHAAGRSQAAKTMYRRAVEAWEASLEPNTPEVAATLEEYAKLLRDLGNVVQAREAESRAAAIRATMRFQ